MKSRSFIWCKNLILGILVITSLRSIACGPPDVVWTGNSDSNWNNAANWGGSLPASNNEALIDPSNYTGAGASPVIFSNSTFTPNRITVRNGGILTIQANVSTGNNAVSVSGSGSEVILTGGTLSIRNATRNLEVGSQASYTQTGGVLQCRDIILGSGELTIDNDASVQINRNLELNGTVLFSSSNITGIGTNNFTMTGGTLTMDENYTFPSSFESGTVTSGVVNYSGSNQQIEGIITYNVLNLSGSGTKTMNQNLTISGNLTLSNGVILDANNFNINLGGNFDNQNTIPAYGFVDDSCIITLNGSGIQTLTHAGNSLSFYGLTLNNSSGLSLDDNLFLKGPLTLSLGTLTTNNKLTLLSSAQRTASVNQITGGAISGNVTVQRYVSNGASTWRHLSSPLSNGDLEQIDDDIITTGIPNSDYPNFPSAANPWKSIVYYDETHTESIDSGWTAPANMTDAMVPGKGYFVYSGNPAGGTNPFVIDYYGIINTGNINLNVSYTAAQGLSTDGWNLVGNPYPCSISWSDTDWTAKTGLDASIHIWNPSNQQYAAYNENLGAGINGGTDTIASCQGFFVHANMASASLIASEGIKVANDDQATFFKKSENTNRYFKLKMEGFGKKDELLVWLNPKATENYDPLYDAYKFEHSWGVPNISIMMNGKEYSINAFRDTNYIEMDMNTVVTTTGDYTILLDSNASMDKSYCVYLKDSQTDSITDLNLTEYSFNMNAETDSSRMKLIFDRLIAKPVFSDTVLYLSKGAVLNYSTASTSSSHEWIFPAFVSTTETGNFQFSDAGEYNILYTAINEGCSSSVSKRVVVIDDLSLAVNNNENELSGIWVNNQIDFLTVNYSVEENTILSFRDLSGKRMQDDLTINGSGSFQYDKSKLATGVYLIHAVNLNSGKEFNLKVLK